MNVPLDMPSCMEEALELIHEDRAWVACIPTTEGVEVIRSVGTMAEVEEEPDASRFVGLDVDKEIRVAFLISGVRWIANRVLTGES